MFMQIPKKLYRVPVLFVLMVFLSGIGLKKEVIKQKITGKWGEYKFISYQNTQYDVISKLLFCSQN